MRTDDAVIRAVKRLCGTPYEFGSRVPSIGLDCLTLVHRVYVIAGGRFPLPPEYKADRIPDTIFSPWFAQHFEPCGVADPWAIVDMWPTHAGVVIPGTRQMIHCVEGVGVVIQRLSRFAHVIRGYHRVR